MKERLIKTLRENSMPKGKMFKLTSGSHSNTYIDVKASYGVPGFLSLASLELFRLIDHQNVTCVAGSGYGGIQLVASYVTLHYLPSSYVRPERKEHGTEKQIEGYFPNKKDKVVILDDVSTKGKTLERIANIIEEQTGAEIIQACVIIKREELGLKFPVKSILTLDDLF